MRKIKEIILHCSATPEGRNIKAADIRRWHKAQGWSDIGYHYVVDIDGMVEKGRAISLVGAHCTGRNAESLGVVYVGGLAKDGKTAKDTRTNAQKVALFGLVDHLIEEYNLSIDKVRCHNEFAAKACPSFERAQFVKEFNEWKKGGNV